MKQKMKILNHVFENIMLSFPPAPPECGGIIGGKNEMITVYCFDRTGPTNQAVYIPNAIYLNAVIEKWRCCGIAFYGIVHSHPNHEPGLSDGDIQYIKDVMKEMEIGSKLYFPVVLTKRLIPYVAIKTKRSVKIEQEELEILKVNPFPYEM